MAKMSTGTLSRRTMFRAGGALAAGATLSGIAGLVGPGAAQAAEEEMLSASAHDQMDSIETMLNLAATAETLAVTHYHAALTSGGLDLSDAEKVILRAALSSELQHLEFINASGGKALTDQFYVRRNAYSDRAEFVSQTDFAEVIFVGAWLAATRRFAELGNPRLAATAAQVAAVEQSHKALIRTFGPGLVPNNVSLAQPVLYNVSDAVPFVAPFLSGGEGMVGPARYPGADEARKVIGDGGTLAVPPFTMVF